jgi:lysyl-tRNA synthetase class 2
MFNTGRRSIDPVLVIKKASIFRKTRDIMDSQGFIEVQTPLVHSVPDYPVDGGYALNCDGAEKRLRICMELRLRQLLAAGLDSVYEIGPCFRKETDPERTSEFYLMECFRRGVTLDELMRLTWDIYRECAACAGSDLAAERFIKLSAVSLFRNNEIEKARQIYNNFEFCDWFDGELNARMPYDDRKTAIFIVDYPVETISIARRQKSDLSLIERFEFFADCGTGGPVEIAHGFTDSTDADDVKKRMGDINWMNGHLIEALENKVLPESGGVGIGMERLLQSVCGICDIRKLCIPDEIEIKTI